MAMQRAFPADRFTYSYVPAELTASFWNEALSKVGRQYMKELKWYMPRSLRTRRQLENALASSIGATVGGTAGGLVGAPHVGATLGGYAGSAALGWARSKPRPKRLRGGYDPYRMRAGTLHFKRKDRYAAKQRRAYYRRRRRR